MQEQGLVKKSVHFGCIFLLLALTLIYFLPLLSAGDKFILGSYPDAFSFAWNFWWAKHFTQFGDSVQYSSAIFHPNGSSLVLHSFVPLLTIPFSYLSFEPQVLLLLASIFCFFANVCAAYFLGYALSRDAVLASCFALLLGFHPFLVGHLFAGHLNFLVLFPLLLIFREAVTLKAKSRVTPFLVVSFICLVVLSWSNLYYTYFALILVAIVIVTHIRQFSSQHIPSIGLLFLTGAALLFRLLPVVKASSSGLYSPHHKALTHSADVLHYFLSPVTSFFPLCAQDQGLLSLTSAEAGLAIGAGMLGVFLLALLRYPRRLLATPWLILAAVFFLVLSLGPTVQLAGTEVFSNYVYRALRSLLPGFPTVPARFGIVAILALYCLLFSAVKARGLLLIGSLVTLLGFYPVSLPYYETLQSEALVKLRSDDTVKAVAFCTDSLYEPIRAQIIHEKAIVAGFLARRPLKAEQSLRTNRFLKFLQKGKVSDETTLRRSFEKLKVQAIICPTTHTEIVQRLESLEFMTLRYSDAANSVFMLPTPLAEAS